MLKVLLGTSLKFDYKSERLLKSKISTACTVITAYKVAK